MRALSIEGVHADIHNLNISKAEKAAVLKYRYDMPIKDLQPDHQQQKGHSLVD